MTDLPRYEELFDHDLLPHPDGPWVKWADVSARLQQLEQEKAKLQAALAQAVVEFAMEKGQVDAALAETREALHQLTEKYDALTRGDSQGVPSDASVPQGRTRVVIPTAPKGEM